VEAKNADVIEVESGLVANRFWCSVGREVEVILIKDTVFCYVR
jgi:hypothetical protein